MDLTYLQDKLQDISDTMEEIATGLNRKQPAPIVNVSPPKVEIIHPEQKQKELKITVSAPAVSVPVTVARAVPTGWEFTVTQRDINGHIEKFTATPV